MEAVSSMESLGAMDFYEEEDNRTAFLAIRIKEEVELESNQIKDDINNMHDCQQDPDNMQVNELQLFMGKEEEEEDGGNASKVDEGGKTVSVYGDADDMKDEETSPSNMDVRNKNELCTSGVIRMSNLKSVKGSNEDKDIISKKDGVPEQAQRLTGPADHPYRGSLQPDQQSCLDRW